MNDAMVILGVLIPILVIIMAWSMREAVHECRMYRELVKDDADMDIKLHRKVAAIYEKRAAALERRVSGDPIALLTVPQWTEDNDACDDCDLGGICPDNFCKGVNAPCMFDPGNYGIYAMPPEKVQA